MTTAPAFDRRLTPARGDLAAAHLRGVTQADRYVEGDERVVRAPSAPLRPQPVDGYGLDTVLLYGDRVMVYEDRDGWAWLQSMEDDYVGYAPAAALGAPGLARTHQVCALATHLYPEPNVKAETVGAMSMGAYGAVTAEQGAFSRLDDGLYVPTIHLAQVDAPAPDFVAVAAMVLNVPYLWGGKTAAGLDCSGLIQIAMTRAGLACPRDADMQEAVVGSPIDPAAPRRRGDLIFWPGHVGVMADADTLLHANAHHMAVAMEPLAQAAARIAAAPDGAPIRSVRRIQRKG